MPTYGPLAPQIEQFIHDNPQGVLTSFRRSGMPQLSIVTVYPRDGGVGISITENRMKFKNLLRDPRCSVLISHADWWSGFLVFEAGRGLHRNRSPAFNSFDKFRVGRGAAGASIMRQSAPAPALALFSVLLVFPDRSDATPLAAPSPRADEDGRRATVTRQPDLLAGKLLAGE